ncbi:MAG: DUF86 domain-containing protein [Desulfurococcales archaeon]|nr:DUF86 domain-containing protein [Desulfurococcales archaeon]
MILERMLSRVRMYYREYVEALRDYRAGRERIYAVERLAQLIAQGILDYAAILAAREEGAKPGTYKGLAEWLSKRLGLPDHLRSFLVGLAGFRNILVHLYAEMDRDLEEKAFEEIERSVPPILDYLERTAGGDPCIEDVRRSIGEVAKRYGLRYALVFGSIARRGCGRDVDVAIKLGRIPESMIEVGRIQAELEEALGSSVDVVILDLPIDPVLAKAIVDEARIVYGDQGEALRDMLNLYKAYLDYVEEAKKLKGKP